jgi:menaquinone-dependent protoporphyrinogen oxidase
MTTRHAAAVCEFPVFYATTEGQTRRIAERLATRLYGHGFDSRAIDVTSAEAAGLDWTRVCGAIVGASLHAGRHQKTADRFVRANLAHLNAVPTAFVSVSLSAASKKGDEVKAAEKLAREFPPARGWKPATVASIAGRLAYLEYNFFTRMVMKWIARSEGAPTDTSRDYALTDWDEVDKLARDMTARVRPRIAA